ncbi:MAG: branched-chain amino acid ABC transporter permease [Anaerolineae bacterium]
MEHSLIFYLALLWIIIWGAVGGVVTPRIYRRKDLDVTQAPLAGTITGAAGGPFTLIPLWVYTPTLDWKWVALPGVFAVGIIVAAFARADPNNFCVTSSSFVTEQVVNGLVIGVIYGLMALGLTLIFSILGIVSFAHGEFYMIGGMAVYFLIEVWFPGLHPVAGLFGAAIITFIIGVIFERLFLQIMYTGGVERPGEYAILVTFGLAFFLQYITLALVNANPKKVARFFDYPEINLPSAGDPSLLAMKSGTVRLLDYIAISTPRITAGIIALLMLGLLMWFLYYTWIGRALRAVSQDRQAAAAVGINPDTMNTLAFGLGGMLAGLSGASLVQVLSWVPWVGTFASARSFVVIVLGGMGSLPGAFVGGLVVGVVEKLGEGCVPDPQRAAAYSIAYGMAILVLVLLLKPTGLFGRKL